MSPQKFENREFLHLNNGPITDLFSRNKLLKIFYSNYEAKYPFKHKDVWTFTAVRQFKRSVAKTYPEKWNKYIKSKSKQPNKDLVIYVKNYFECSSKEAKEYINILATPEISRILTDRGLGKKEIKPLLK